MPDIAALMHLTPGSFAFACGVIGLIVGSFLNVVILRLPARIDHACRAEAREILQLAEESELPEPRGPTNGRSHCPACDVELASYDNVPVISWLLLRGKCRHCHTSISAQYPLVEAGTAILSVVVAYHFGETSMAFAGLVFTWMLIALSGIDIRTKLLPDEITLPMLWLGLLVSLGVGLVDPVHAILGAATAYGGLWAFIGLMKLLTGKEGMGHGDFKLLAALGAWFGPPAVMPILLMACLLFLVAAALLHLRGQKTSGVQIPFGPAIAAAGWVWLSMGLRIQGWHLPIL